MRHLVISVLISLDQELSENVWVLGKLGPGQLGPEQLGPGKLGPGQLGPGAQLSGAQLSAPKKWQIGPRTVGPRGPVVRGPTVHLQKVANWAPDSRAPGPSGFLDVKVGDYFAHWSGSTK